MKNKPFLNQYNWKDIDFPSNQKDWKKFEKNNMTIALNILFVPHNTKEIKPAYKSKYNNDCNNKVILLMITDGEKWHCLAVKSLLALFRGIKSNHAVLGEEILPSNQQQIIEQAKFTCSPLGKAFEKQIKTIEDQGEKQINAIQNQGQVKAIKNYTYDNEDTPLISKQKETFINL